MDSVGGKQPSTPLSSGDEEEPAPWRPMSKKLSTTTSPPWSNKQAETTEESRTPLNKSVCIDLCWDEDEARSIKKRKRIPSDNPEKTHVGQKEADHKKLKKVKELIRNIDELSRTLVKHVANNSNTKKEIKETISTLRTRSSQLNTADMWALVNSLTFNQGHIQEEKTLQMMETAETSTQTENSTSTQTTQTDEEVSTFLQPKNGLSQLYRAENINSILKAISVKWNEKGYPKTRPGIGNPLSSKNNTVIILDPKAEAKGKTTRTVTELYPHTDTFINAGMPKDGKSIQISTVISSEETENAEQGKTVYLLGDGSITDDQQPENIDKWAKLYEGLKKIIEKESGKNVKQMTIYHTTDTDIVKVRRLMEKILQHLDMTVTIFSSDSRRSKPETLPKTLAEPGTSTTNLATEETPTWNKPKRKNKTETITIKGVETQMYSEVLRNLKKNINISDMNIKVNNISHNKKNEVKIKFLGDAQEEEKFLEAVKKHTDPNMEVLVEKHVKSVFIKDINYMTEKDEVLEALKTTLNVSESEIEIKMAEKPNRENLLYAIARLPIDQANALIGQKRVRVGWNNCRVEETYNPIVCYNCYKYGHITKNCTNERKERSCLNCTSRSHQAKDCKANSKCLNCENGNHKTFSFSCPHYRKAILIQRQKRTMI